MYSFATYYYSDRRIDGGKKKKKMISIFLMNSFQDDSKVNEKKEKYHGLPSLAWVLFDRQKY